MRAESSCLPISCQCRERHAILRSPDWNIYYVVVYRRYRRYRYGTVTQLYEYQNRTVYRGFRCAQTRGSRSILWRGAAGGAPRGVASASSAPTTLTLSTTQRVSASLCSVSVSLAGSARPHNWGACCFSQVSSMAAARAACRLAPIHAALSAGQGQKKRVVIVGMTQEVSEPPGGHRVEADRQQRDAPALLAACFANALVLCHTCSSQWRWLSGRSAAAVAAGRPSEPRPFDLQRLQHQSRR